MWFSSRLIKRSVWTKPVEWMIIWKTTYLFKLYSQLLHYRCVHLCYPNIRQYSVQLICRSVKRNTLCGFNLLLYFAKLQIIMLHNLNGPIECLSLDSVFYENALHIKCNLLAYIICYQTAYPVTHTSFPLSV